MELVAAGVGIQQTGADQMGVLGKGVEVEHIGQINDHICSDRDIHLAGGKALRLKVQSFGLNDIGNTTSLLRMRPRRGRKRKKARTSLEEESKESKKGRNSLSGSTIPPPPPPAPAVPTLSTANLYFVGCKNDQQAISVEDKLTEMPSLQRGVEVPKWREDINHYALCVFNNVSLKKSKEGGPTWRTKSTNPLNATEAEPTDDASYLKRHGKHEKDEKQRKRWDVQRMRQEQQLQKLRARQEKKTLDQSKSKADLKCQGTSLLPALEEVTAICVEDVVPISIFGRPLPDTATVDFSLPWL